MCDKALDVQDGYEFKDIGNTVRVAIPHTKPITCQGANHEKTVNKIKGDNVHRGTIELNGEWYYITWQKM